MFLKLHMKTDAVLINLDKIVSINRHPNGMSTFLNITYNEWFTVDEDFDTICNMISYTTNVGKL